MARTLVLKNKLRSLLGQIDVFNESDKLAYRAIGEWSWGSARWRLHRAERELAVLRRPSGNALMSLRDRHQVEILDEHAELLCIVAMVVIKADRNSEAAAAAS